VGLVSGRRTVTGREVARRSTSYFGISGPQDLIPPRPFIRTNMPVITNETALRHSAVWACLRLRADLISTLPVDVYRKVNGLQVEAVKPPVLSDPGGAEVNWLEWMYSTQFDLDRAGNTVGLITEVDGFGLPRKIELQQIAEVTIKVRDGRINKFKVGMKEYEPSAVWHEKQYTVAGLHVGLSPIQYAAFEIGQYLTVQEFATNWFAAGALPKARLQNKAKQLSTTEIATIKEAWRAAMATDEPFVHGNDWDYEMISAQQASQDWLESKRFSVTDVARFLGCPSELIDSAPTGESRPFTYANISQKNLEFLIMNLGPAITRREAKLSTLLPVPRFLKLNADALLRLDPISRAQVIKTQIDSRTLTPDEGRELENRPPLTAAQVEQFDHFWPPPGTPQNPDPGNGAGVGYGDEGDPLGEGDLIPQTDELSAGSPWTAGPQFGRPLALSR
jgi:HK97 family phage portal protein